MKETISIKRSGQVFTPDFLVADILNFCGYCGNGVLQKHVIDNSCGDGAFLCEIVNRYCNVFFQNSSDINILKSELQTYVHGIELDKIAYQNCLYNLSKTAKEYGIENVNWSIKNDDALGVTCFNGKMDFVVGNPPYVRVHNLEHNYDKVKTFLFANGGMTDLFLVFFELGFRMLNSTGKLCYITPSSWLNSRAAENMRKHIRYEKSIVGLIDLGHFQAFENATTYTLISLFENGATHKTFDYFVYDETAHDKHFIDTLSFEDIVVGTEFYLSSKAKLKKLREIKTSLHNSFVRVKNGFATLADDVFIGELPFSTYTIPVLKASTGKWKRGFFPYDKLGKPLSYEKLFEHAEIHDYLTKNEQNLLKGRTIEENPQWYLYGRTQALKDVYVNKYAINTIIKNTDSIKLNVVPAGSGLYGGLYILTELSFEIIEELVISDDFIDYLKMLKNYKSGGYYTFNSRDLEQYLNSKITKLNYEQTSNRIPTKQQRISQGYLEFI